MTVLSSSNTEYDEERDKRRGDENTGTSKNHDMALTGSLAGASLAVLGLYLGAPKILMKHPCYLTVNSLA